MEKKEHIELELKWNLDENNYHKTLDIFIKKDFVLSELHQKNHFFDTKDNDLLKNKMALRIREENKTLILTCKYPSNKKTKKGAFVHIEHETKLNHSCLSMFQKEISSSWAPLPIAYRKILENKQLMLIGSFSNLRYQTTNDKETICLDSTTFPKSHRYELEIETDNEEKSYDYWNNWLKKNDIVFEIQTESKMAVFLKEKTS